jgi:phospholipase/lecithinase/hemolysin
MRRTYIAVTALTLAILVGGCGGSDSSEKSSSGSSAAPASQEQARDDAAAKARVREAVSELEACFVDEMDYAPCAKSAVGPGIKASGTTAGFTVAAASNSGNTFVMAKGNDGGLTRTCTAAGKGGCPAGGAW